MQLKYVENYTPFEWFAFEKMAPRHALFDVVVVKAALPMAHALDRLNTTPEHALALPIEMADRSRQSDLGAYAPLKVAGDTVIFKPGTDVLLCGHARPVRSKLREWPAQVTIQTARALQQQTMVLQGERHWQYSLLKGWRLSETQPVDDPLPLIYELAYGGSYLQKDEWEHHSINPVGRGYLPAHRFDKEVYYPAAQIELHKERLQTIDKPVAVPALGPINRVWNMRSQYAGTYDQAWFEQPAHALGRDYPQDFDLRFFQVAAPPWIFTPHFSGGETIELLGLSGDQPCYTQIPRWQPMLTLYGAQQPTPVVIPMILDTVELNMDALQTKLTWRASVVQTAQISGARIDLRQDAQPPQGTHMEPRRHGR